MDEFKGTKGDWFFDGEGSVSSEFLIEKIKDNEEYKNENGEICQCWADEYDGNFISDEECNYNAKLIASAPKLLKLALAVKEFIGAARERHEITGELEITYQKVCKIIKEATE